MHVEAHVAVGGVDKYVVGAAGNLEMAVGLEFGRRLVINDLVGAEDVIAVVHHYVAVGGDHIACICLVLCIQLNGQSACGRRLRLGDRQHLLIWVVWQLRACVTGGSGDGNGGRLQGCG